MLIVLEVVTQLGGRGFKRRANIALRAVVNSCFVSTTKGCYTPQLSPAETQAQSISALTSPPRALLHGYRTLGEIIQPRAPPAASENPSSNAAHPGHGLWLFGNQIRYAAQSLKSFAPGAFGRREAKTPPEFPRLVRK